MKRLTAKQMMGLLTEVTLNAYHHLQCIDKELQELNINKLDNATEDQKRKVSAVTMTFVLVNDLIHPLHRSAKTILKKEYLPLIDSYIKRHKISIDQKLVDPCFCSSCTADEVSKRVDALKEKVNHGIQN